MGYLAMLDGTSGKLLVIPKVSVDETNGNISSQGTIAADVDVTKAGVSVVSFGDSPLGGDLSGSFAAGLQVASVQGKSLGDGQVWSYSGGSGDFVAEAIAGASGFWPHWAFSSQSGAFVAHQPDPSAIGSGYATNPPAALNDYIQFTFYATSGTTWRFIIVYHRFMGGGIVGVQLDGIPLSSFDCDDPSGLGFYNQMLELNGIIIDTPGSHTLTLIVNGTSGGMYGAWLGPIFRELA